MPSQLRNTQKRLAVNATHGVVGDITSKQTSWQELASGSKGVFARAVALDSEAH
jgi:hypothetical protein